MNRERASGKGSTGRRFRGSLALLTAGLVLATASSSTAAVTARIRLSRAVGPPTTVLTVSGRAFGPSETVDLAFDAQPRGTATTDPTGGFSAPLKVPASALPGDHTVTATGESSGLSAQAPFTVRTDWPMFHFSPQHTGLNPYENVLSTQNVSGLAVGWTISGPEFFVTSPAVSGARVFVGATDTLYALDRGTGALLWQDTLPYSYTSDPVAQGGRVYYVASGAVHAVDAATGEERWSYGVGGSIDVLTVSGGVIYAGSIYGSYAIDATTGHLLWHLTGPVYAAPALAEGVLYVSGIRGTGYLNALDPATGAELWTGGSGINVSSPAVAGGMVYVGSDDHNIYAFTAAGCGQATCSPVWTYQTGSAVESSPSVAQGTMYVGSEDGYLYALDAASGALKWSVQTGGAVEASPVVANGVVYDAGGDGNARAVDALSGQVLWTYPMEGSSADSPAVADGWLYVGSLDGKQFYAFHLPG